MKPFKKSLLLNFVFIFLASFSFAQNDDVIRSLDKSGVRMGVTEGALEFYLPKGITNEQVQESASYYTMYFDVAYNEETGLVGITMKTNDSKSRHIIVRFFVSLNLRNIEIDGTEMTVEEYYQEYLK